jgi:hypothetical protein
MVSTVPSTDYPSDLNLKTPLISSSLSSMF